MEDNKFWAIVWALVTSLLAVICITIGANFALSNQLIGTMVKNGADPIAASCAVNGFSNTAGSAVVCLEAAK